MANNGPVVRTGWTGWIMFASIMLVIVGFLQAFYGLVAAVNPDWAGWQSKKNMLLSFTSWGWVHLVIGLIVIAVGLGIMAGNVLARTAAVIIAAGSLVTNFAFIPAAPAWAVTLVVIDLLVIWALIVHGGEMRSDNA